MLKYFDDIVGKDLGWDVLAQLLFYFAVFMTPIAIPLAVLLSSLMTFGNLGEHFELTAIKSAGISLLRALFPIFIFVLGLTVVAFYSNNYFVPKAALEAYSLLYDIKQKKPALDLKQGAFYTGIPDFSIKVEKKYDDGKTIEDIIMYDHRSVVGNKKVILADSGLMYTINNDRYLKLELFKGNFYFEDFSETSTSTNSKKNMSRSSFQRSEYVLDLSSFGLDRTDKSLFEGNRIMRNMGQLASDVDSVDRSISELKLKVFDENRYAFFYHMREDSVKLPKDLEAFKQEKIKQALIKKDTVDSTLANRDSVNAAMAAKYQSKIDADTNSSKKNSGKSSVKVNPEVKLKNTAAIDLNKNAPKKRNNTLVSKTISKGVAAKNLKKRAKSSKIKIITDTLNHAEIVDYTHEKMRKDDLQFTQTVLNNVRQAKTKLQSHNSSLDRMSYDKNVFSVQYHKILANSVACIIMFLIGAPLGAIIKRGGLGMPVLLSILFFIIFYVISMTGEKYSKQGIVDPLTAIWAANFILFPIGLFFLRQARNDVRLFEADFYNVIIERVKAWFSRQKTSKQNAIQ